MLLYSPLWLFLVPGAVLAALGVAGFTAILLGTPRPGGVALGINTMLVAAMAMILGFQLVTFGLFARVFAAVEGLAPPDRRVTDLLERASLEKGVVAGLLVFLAGVAVLVAATVVWQHTGFGELPPVESMRMSIPGMALTVLGMQIVFSSFLLSLVGLKRK